MSMQKIMILHVCLGILLLGIVITPSVFAGDGCGTGTVLVDGVCQLSDDRGNVLPIGSGGCGTGTKMVDGVCHLDNSFNISGYVGAGAAAIGAAIIGIIFVVRRGSGGTSTPKPAREELEEYESRYIARKPAEKKETSSSCNSCGTRLKPTAKFCGKCGSKQ